MQVNTNINALTAANALTQANQDAARASQRLSTTLRINTAADDPSVFSTLNTLKAKIASYTVANDNINNANGMLQTMNGALTSIADTLSKMRALAVSGSSTTASADAQTAFTNYISQIDALVGTTKWNGTSLLNSAAGTVSVQTGILSGEQTTVSLYDARTSALGVSTSTISSTANAATALTAIDAALTTLSGYQTGVGAAQNRLNTQIAYNSSMSTASNTAYARLTGADVAQETANLAAAQIRQNSAAAMLAQANQMDKDIVSTLLRQFAN